jgi:hypothetical protein
MMIGNVCIYIKVCMNKQDFNFKNFKFRRKIKIKNKKKTLKFQFILPTISTESIEEHNVFEL